MTRRFASDSYEIRQLDDKISVDAYADVEIWTVAPFKSKIITFTATTNNLSVTIQYSNDLGGTWTNVESEFSVTTAAKVVKTYTTLYGQLKIKVKSAAPGNAGVLSTVLFGSSLS